MFDTEDDNDATDKLISINIWNKGDGIAKIALNEKLPNSLYILILIYI